jgi:hypothetical protein
MSISSYLAHEALAKILRWRWCPIGFSADFWFYEISQRNDLKNFPHSGLA